LTDKDLLRHFAQVHTAHPTGRPRPGPRAPGPERTYHVQPDTGIFGRTIFQGYSTDSEGGHRSSMLYSHRGLGVRGRLLGGP
jgi:hypothetical protein